MSKTKSKNTKSSSIGKENIGMLGNWHSNEIYSRLKSLPFPEEEFEASDLSSIVSQSQLKSKEIFQGGMSKKSSLRNVIEHVQLHDAKGTNRKRISLEKKNVINTNPIIKSMLSDKVQPCYAQPVVNEVQSLRQTNQKLLAENKLLKQQLDNLQQHHLKESSTKSHQTFESRAPTIQTSSFDSFQRLEADNRMLRERLQLSKKSNKETLASRQSQIVHSASELHDLYNRVLTKGQAPRLQNFFSTLKKYFAEYQDILVKTNLIFKQFQEDNLNDRYLQTKQLVSLLKLPMMFKNRPNMLDSIMSMSKSGVRSGSRDKYNPVQSFSAELLSSEQTVQLLQQLLTKVLKSNNMMRLCRQNRNLLSLVSRVRG